MTIAGQLKLHFRIYHGFKLSHGDIGDVLVEYWHRNIVGRF